MAEFILYRGNMATVFFSRGDADAAIRSGEYRRSPISAIASSDGAIAKPTAKPANPGALNLNEATLEELVALPGVGIARAKNLIDMRPIESIEDAIAVTNAADWQKLFDDGKIRFS